MLCGDFFAVLFWSGVGVVSSDVLLICMLVSKFEGLLDRSAFVMWLVFFGHSFGLKVAIGVLKGTKYRDVVWSGLPLPGQIFLLIRWDLS